MRANSHDLHPNDATGVQVYIVDELNYWCAKFGCTLRIPTNVGLKPTDQVPFFIENSRADPKARG